MEMVAHTGYAIIVEPRAVMHTLSASRRCVSVNPFKLEMRHSGSRQPEQVVWVVVVMPPLPSAGAGSNSVRARRAPSQERETWSTAAIEMEEG